MAKTRREPRKLETGLTAEEEANINSYSEQELRAKIESSAIASAPSLCSTTRPRRSAPGSTGCAQRHKRPARGQRRWWRG